MEKIRLLIASEDSSSRRGITAIFSNESVFNVVGSFLLEEAVEKAVLIQPDVILLDISGDMLKHGPKVNQFKKNCPCSINLILVDKEMANDLTEIIPLDIDGCIPKGITRSCLVKAVELACRARVFYLPGYYKKMVSFKRPEKISNTGRLKNGLPGSGEFLTRREMEILQLMAQNLSNKDIAGELFISETTVKTHVSNILRKLGQNNRAQVIVYSYKRGLIGTSLACSKRAHI